MTTMRPGASPGTSGPRRPARRPAAEPAVRPSRRLPAQRPSPAEDEPAPVKPGPFKRRAARPSRSARAAWPGRWRLVNAVLAVLLAAAGVTATVTVSRWQEQRRLEGDRQAALAAAKQAAVNFVSVSESTV